MRTQRPASPRHPRLSVVGTLAPGGFSPGATPRPFPTSSTTRLIQRGRVRQRSIPVRAVAIWTAPTRCCRWLVGRPHTQQPTAARPIGLSDVVDWHAWRAGTGGNKATALLVLLQAAVFPLSPSPLPPQPPHRPATPAGVASSSAVFGDAPLSLHDASPQRQQRVHAQRRQEQVHGQQEQEEERRQRTPRQVRAQATCLRRLFHSFAGVVDRHTRGGRGRER